jgi:hypothetical protein
LGRAGHSTRSSSALPIFFSTSGLNLYSIWVSGRFVTVRRSHLITLTFLQPSPIACFKGF